MMINTDNINTITSAQHLTRAVQTRTKLKTRETNAILNTENTEWEPVYTHANINREQLKDTEIATVYRLVEKGKRPDVKFIAIMSPSVRRYWHIFHLLSLSNRVFVMQAFKNDSTESYFQILTPKQFVKKYYDKPMMPHLQEQILRARYIKKCASCFKSRTPALVRDTHKAMGKQGDSVNLKDEETNWDKYLNFATSAYRSSVYETIGLTPNFLMLG